MAWTVIMHDRTKAVTAQQRVIRPSEASAHFEARRQASGYVMPGDRITTRRVRNTVTGTTGHLLEIETPAGLVDWFWTVEPDGV
jgi:hypothetical protein